MINDKVNDIKDKDKELVDKKEKKFIIKKKKRVCEFCSKDSNNNQISYKDEKRLRKFISERGKILPRRVTGTCQKHQRELVVAIKRARHMAILPYVIE